MERKNFLKTGIGLIGIGAIANSCTKEVDSSNMISANHSDGATAARCIETPSEMEGPYPYPKGEIKNPLNRSDVREDQTGIPLILNFTVVNIMDGCKPVPNARVDIWSCDKDGYYSGYRQFGYLGFKNNTGKTWLRGYQIANEDGQVQFLTIYPGWYPGRATHVHMEVFVDNILKKTAQIAFPEAVNDRVYKTSDYSAHGLNPTSNADDNIFGNNLDDLKNETVVIKKAGKSLATSYQIGIIL